MCITFIDVRFCNVHIIGPINVCTNFETKRYNIDEFIKYANIVCFISRHVMQKRYIVPHRPEVSTTSGSKAMTQRLFFMFFVTLTIILYPIIALRNFRRIRQVLMCYTAADTQTNTHTHKQTHAECKTIVSQIPSGRD